MSPVVFINNYQAEKLPSKTACDSVADDKAMLSHAGTQDAVSGGKISEWMSGDDADG